MHEWDPEAVERQTCDEDDDSDQDDVLRENHNPLSDGGFRSCVESSQSAKKRTGRAACWEHVRFDMLEFPARLERRIRMKVGLSHEELELTELRFSLASLLLNQRQRLGYTQSGVATLLGSSQSRVAKMEAGDPSVSIDLLIRSLLVLGVGRKEVGKAIGRAGSA